MDKENHRNPPMFLWKAKKAGRGEHTNSPVGDSSLTRGIFDAQRTDASFHGPQTPSPRNVPVLPLDIVVMILKEAGKLPLSRADRQVLVACTLVCKSWLPLAQSLLYHSVIVQAGSYYAVTRDPGTCGSRALLQQSHVLEFTRSLSISVHGKAPAKSLKHLSEDFTPKGFRKRTRVPDFFALLDHTPRLQCLTLTVGSADKNISPFEPHILYWLPSLKLSVEVLDIQDFVGGGSFLRSAFFYHLVRIWKKTIQALRVATGDACDDGLSPERPNLRLRELRLHPTRSAAAIEWLLPPPPLDEQSNLRFLELHGIPEEARAVLSVHGPSVSSLTLTFQPKFEVAQLFTNLEELVITAPDWTGLSAFPRTLKHIRLEVLPFLPGFLFLPEPDTLVAAIAKELPTLPDLRVISIEEALTANKYYPDLQKACETHKVEILFSRRPNDSSTALVRGSDLSATPFIH